MRSGLNHVAAGIAAAIALPLATLMLNLAFPIALPLSAALYAGIALLLAPRPAVQRIKPGQVGRVQAELVAGLIDEGEAAVARLREAARELRAKEAGRLTGHLAEGGAWHS